MKIGITQRICKVNNIKKDCLSLRWYDFFKYYNKRSILYPIPNNSINISKWLDTFRFDIIVLTGGNDIGEEPVRDKTEKYIIKYCIQNKIPLLGVCRGLQFLNLFFNGKISNVKNVTNIIHTNSNHHIYFNDKIPFFKSFNKKILVNSFHNYCVTLSDISPCLIAIAKIDAVIECLIHRRHKILGVQWHPERYNNFKKTDFILLDYLLQND